jgi:Ca2+-binding RTX toxin-like protein
LPRFKITLRRLNSSSGEVYQEYFEIWKELGGGLFANFTDVAISGNWGSWGIKERWNEESTAKFDAVLNFMDNNDRWWADGSNGQTIGEFLRGQGDADALTGSAFNDTVLGGAGDDALTGGTGNDYLHGEAGRDRLDGNAGDDVLMGGAGRDSLIGGLGNDQFRFSSPLQGTDVIADFNRKPGEVDRIVLVDSGFQGLQTGLLSAQQYGEGYSVFEAAAAAWGANNGQAGAAMLAVNKGSAVEVYYDADTTLEGNERLLAVLNNQSISNLNQDYFRVVTGDDTGLSTELDPLVQPVAATTALNLRGSNASDLMRGEGRNDTLNGAEGHDLVHGAAGNDRLIGFTGDDRLFGGNGNDRVQGDAGDDALSGGEGNDTLLGGAGIDRLQGFAGDDLLRGGAGRDILTGGSGNDQFVFGSIAELGDVVTDLNGGGSFDQIVLQGSSFSRLAVGTLGQNQFGALAREEYNLLQTWLDEASQNAINANGGETGAAILAIEEIDGVTVSLYYDGNTGISGGETFLATLNGQNLNTFSADNFLISR